MKLISYLNRPEYFFRPSQIPKRLFQANTSLQEFEDVQLPWGVTIKIRPNEDLGLAIWKMGIYDLCVTELLWRLLDEGETAIDIGANIGYMTSLMAQQVGKTGKVLCFEPHPEIYQELSDNLKTWQAERQWFQIKAYQVALSSEAGEGFLATTNYFNSNRGTASLATVENAHSSLSTESKGYSVPLAKLDDIIDPLQTINLIKIDVEGHEINVLEGAKTLFNNQQVRDVIFEDHASGTSPVTQFFENRGYTIFRITKGFFKPLIGKLEEKIPSSSPFWEPPSYLATQNPARAIDRLEKRGWRSLQFSKN